MEGNSASTAQGDLGMTSTDWRSELSAASRQIIVDRIIATLMKHLPISGPFGVLELKKIAERFEERMHTTSTSQPDYLRRISIKMLQMEPISACNFVTGGEFLQVPGQGNLQNTSSASQTQNQARLYGDMAFPSTASATAKKTKTVLFSRHGEGEKVPHVICCRRGDLVLNLFGSSYG